MGAKHDLKAGCLWIVTIVVVGAVLIAVFSLFR